MFEIAVQFEKHRYIWALHNSWIFKHNKDQHQKERGDLWKISLSKQFRGNHIWLGSHGYSSSARNLHLDQYACRVEAHRCKVRLFSSSQYPPLLEFLHWFLYSTLSYILPQAHLPPSSIPSQFWPSSFPIQPFVASTPRGCGSGWSYLEHLDTRKNGLHMG